MKFQGLAAIKVVSSLLMLSALGLELWNLETVLARGHLPSGINWIFVIERFAVSAHLLEATIAAIFASSRGEKPLPFAIYTFFVGTVGLWELFTPNHPLGFPNLESSKDLSKR